MTGDTVVVQRVIKAPPDTVFSIFTDPQRWLRWQGLDATIEPRPDGEFRINVRGDGYASGHFLEVDPPRRIVFTWDGSWTATRCRPARPRSRSTCCPVCVSVQMGRRGIPQ